MVTWLHNATLNCHLSHKSGIVLLINVQVMPTSCPVTFNKTKCLVWYSLLNLCSFSWPKIVEDRTNISIILGVVQINKYIMPRLQAVVCVCDLATGAILVCVPQAGGLYGQIKKESRTIITFCEKSFLLQ